MPELLNIVYSKDEIAPDISTAEWNKFVKFAGRKFDHSDVMESLGILLEIFSERGE